MNDEFILRDDKMFFNLVRTTPDYIEATDLLFRARTAVIAEKRIAERDRDTHQNFAMDLLLTKLRDEIRYINEREARVRLKTCVKEVFGQDGYEKYISYVDAKRYPDLRAA